MSIQVKQNINDVLPIIRSFAALRPIAEKAEAKLSFWGYRDVEVSKSDGSLFEGSLSLNALPALFIQMAEQSSNFNEQDGRVGKCIEKHINRIYKKSDALISERNYFTQFLAYARDFFSGLYECCTGADSTQIRWEGEFGTHLTYFPTIPIQSD